MEHEVDVADKRLIIATPCYDSKVHVSVLEAMLNTKALAGSYGLSVAFYFKAGCSLLDKARNEIVHGFRKGLGTHLLCVDSDVVWNPKDAVKMVAQSVAHPEKILVGAYPTKNKDKAEFHYPITVNEDKTTSVEDGLIQVNTAAAGFMLLSKEHLDTMAEALPEESYYVDNFGEFKGEDIPCLFESKVVDHSYVGEDVLFCRRAADAGLKIWVDPSIRLQHVGEYPYEHDFVEWVKTTYAIREHTSGDVQ